VLRFLTAALAALPGDWRLDGTPRLRQRPVGPLVEALLELGAEVEFLGEEGHPPLRLRGGTLRGGRARLRAGESSQYLSALLMAGLRAPRETEIEVESLTSAPYVELTLAAIARCGGRVERPSPGRFRVVPGLAGAETLRVEGDFSAACYPAAAAALTGGRVELVGLEPFSAQGDRAFFELLARMGARVRPLGEAIEVAGGGRLSAVDADLSTMPDQVPTLAALAPFAAGTTRIRNVPHLRIKESDRLAAMAGELRRLGAEAAEEADGLTVRGTWAAAPPPAGPVIVDPHGDHRIAMSLALVGLRRPSTAVRDPEVVSKSYPDFWRDLEGLLTG
jgi:3-phosphoshikimate 1-carboxyvinyltransferase